MTVDLILGPTVDVDAIALMVDLERRGYDIRVSNGQPFLRPNTGLSWRDADRWRRHRHDVIELVAYCDCPPQRLWG
jgi:hypothetical protein